MSIHSKKWIHKSITIKLRVITKNISLNFEEKNRKSQKLISNYILFFLKITNYELLTNKLLIVILKNQKSEMINVIRCGLRQLK